MILAVGLSSVSAFKQHNIGPICDFIERTCIDQVTRVEIEMQKFYFFSINYLNLVIVFG